MRAALAVVTLVALATASAASPSTPSKGCRPAQTTALVKHFLTAFNHGDRADLNNDLWAGRQYFN